MKWPKECQIEGKTSTDFVKSAFLNILWNAVDIANDAGSGSKKQVCQSTIQISQVDISTGIYWCASEMGQSLFLGVKWLYSRGRGQ